jgi:hypothetical protein
MTSKFWLKLPHRLIHDPEVMMLAPTYRLLVYELALVAGDYEHGGELPLIPHIAYTLHQDAEALTDNMLVLKGVGILTEENGKWYHAAFDTWQEPIGTPERMRAYRQRKKAMEEAMPSSYAAVTHRSESVTNVTEEEEVEVENSASQRRARTRTVRAPEPRQPRTHKPNPVQPLEDFFVAETMLPAPKPVTRKDFAEHGELWVRPLKMILDASGGSEQKASRILRQAIRQLRKDRMTVSNPKSVLKTAIALVAEAKQTPLGKDEDFQEKLARLVREQNQ